MVPLTETNTTDVLAVRILAGKLRPVYQAGLLLWYRDANNKVALSRLLNVMTQLQQVSPDEGLWCSAAEVIKKLLEGNLTCSTSIKLLLGQVERQIRRAMDAGPGTLFSNPPIDLIKNLLHYITVAEGHTDSYLDRSCSQDMATKTVKGEEEFHELCRVIIREVIVDLTQVKDAIASFSKEPCQCDLLNLVPDLMHRINGALTMLCLRRPSIVLKVISHYISHELLAVKIVPPLAALDNLQDVLTSVEYFLETMVESQMNLDSLLDMAEGNIKALGYLVDNIDEVVIESDMSVLAFTGQDHIPPDISSMHRKTFCGEEIVVVDVSAEIEPGGGR